MQIGKVEKVWSFEEEEARKSRQQGRKRSMERARNRDRYSQMMEPDAGETRSSFWEHLLQKLGKQHLRMRVRLLLTSLTTCPLHSIQGKALQGPPQAKRIETCMDHTFCLESSVMNAGAARYMQVQKLSESLSALQYQQQGIKQLHR